MLVELIYRDRIYIACTVGELRHRLAKHAKNYATLQELLEHMTP